MHKIAINKEAKAVKLEGDYGEETTVNTVVSAAQLQTFLRQSRELRWLIAEDGKLWVWPSHDMIHNSVMRGLGYEQGMTGYVHAAGGFTQPPAQMAINVWWYKRITNLGRGGWTEEEPNPLSNPLFYKIMADPSFKIEENRAPEHGMHALRPEEVGKEPEFAPKSSDYWNDEMSNQLFGDEPDNPEDRGPWR